jgi:hypothetical protein
MLGGIKMNFLLNAEKINEDTVLLIALGVIALIVVISMIVRSIRGPRKTGDECNEDASQIAQSGANSANELSGEVIAAITAAIAMAESQSGGIKFKVVSFRRK